MLIGQILNSQATLNNYILLGSLNFVPGEGVTLVVKIINSQLGIRYVVDNQAATVKFIFNKSNNATEEIAGTFMTDDRSIVSAELSSTITEEILGGNFTMEIDVQGNGNEIKKVFVESGLTRNLIGEC